MFLRICKDVIVGTRSHREAWNAGVHTVLKNVCKNEGAAKVK